MDDKKLTEATELKKQLDVLSRELDILKRYEKSKGRSDHCTTIEIVFWTPLGSEMSKNAIRLTREKLNFTFDNTVLMLQADLGRRYNELLSKYEAL